MSLEALYQQVILDHARNPHHYGTLEDTDLHVHKLNPTCGDEIDLYLDVDDDGNIADVKFSGHGCAISQASASIMTEIITGKSLEEARALMGEFSTMMIEKDHEPSEELGDAVALQGVTRFPTRVRCATLGWHALGELIDVEQSGE